MSSTTNTTSTCPDRDDADGLTQPTIVNDNTTSNTSTSATLNDDATPADYTAATPKSDYIDPNAINAYKRFYLRIFLNTAFNGQHEEIIEVMELMLNGRTMAEAARELNRPRMTVHDMHRKGLGIMKEYIEKHPELLELYNLDD